MMIPEWYNQIQYPNPFYPKPSGEKINIESELELLRLEAERLEAWADGSVLGFSRGNSSR